MLVDCKECEKRVAGLVIGCYEYHDAASGPPTRVTLLRCPRCQHPIVVKEEERWFDSWSKPETIYPCEGELLNPDLPDSVRSTMVEARSCRRSGAYTASALMCRKTLEAICAEHAIRARNLADALTEIKEGGLIEGRLCEWADALRIAGNQAAHNVAANVTGEDARDLLEFTEALLEYVFTLRDRFERFKKRRGTTDA